MFPYKIRKPAWGSSKPGAGSTRRGAIGDDGSTDDDDDGAVPPPGVGSSRQVDVVVEDYDPDDPRTVGGNLQRAILMDLIELRVRYRRRVPASPADVATATSALPSPSARRRRRSRGPTVRNDDGGYATTDDGHVSLGSYFSDFKTCFRESHFGAMHTRTIPPRVDRGEYVQLLYSCCFHLLEVSSRNHARNFDGDNGRATSSCWNDDIASYDDNGMNARDLDLSDAIYSIFALYSLHRTNVLPKAPMRRSHHAKGWTPSGKFDEVSLGEAWSMLPIGINSDEDKLYRRTFLSPVRIDRYNFTLLLRLRDTCLARVEQCGVDFMMASLSTMTNDADAVGNGRCEDLRRRRCYCGQARDAAHIIDIMLADDSFFDYCEYHGPHGLEGLCGSPNFYKAHFASIPKNKDTNGPKKNIMTATVPVASGMTKIELNTIGNEDLMLESLDLQNLSKMVESHCSNLNSVITNLRMSRFTDGILQPKQRELVENTLRGIVSRPTYVELIDKLNVEKASSSDSCDASPSRSEAKSPPELQPAESNQKLLLKFPEIFSPFCEIDFTSEAMLIRKAVAKEKKAHLKGGSIIVDAEIQHRDCLVPAENQQDEDSIDDDAPPLTTVQQRKKRRRELDDLSELHQEEMSDDGKSNYSVNDVSIATGPGKKSLLSLLSIPEGNEDEDDKPTDIFAQEDDFSIATGAGRNALLSLLSMAESTFDSDHIDDESLPIEDEESDLRSLESSLNSAAISALNDDASVTCGMGKRALQFLLAGHADDRPLQPAKSRAKKKAPENTKRTVRQKLVKKKERKARLDDGIFAEDNEDTLSNGEFSVLTEDAGRNALAALLSNTETAEV
ncbi:hypothetical protein ACHAXA_006216 [Cyclostephanos tholiformis]|uniref:Uncharacterized protein n=1 Tax=Cyclostephanos tholiformis TaxID=382380 RepID=A0ABD3SEH1_9STRA